MFDKGWVLKEKDLLEVNKIYIAYGEKLADKDTVNMHDDLRCSEYM